MSNECMSIPPLKPCPFCGGEAVVEENKVRKGYEAAVSCNGKCLVHMFSITYETEQEAVDAVIRAWNRRVGESNV